MVQRLNLLSDLVIVYKSVFMGSNSNPVAMTRRYTDMRTNYVDRQCVDALGMWRGYIG